MEAISITVGSDLAAGTTPPEFLPDERQLRHGLARGLGLWAEDLEPLGGDQHPGGGRPLFYVADVAGVSLALCRDGLGVYLMVPPAGEQALEEALTILRGRGLHVSPDLDQDLEAGQRGWRKIAAAGAVPGPAPPSRPDWLYADRTRERVSAAALGQRAAAMLNLFQRVAFSGAGDPSGPVLMAYPGQVVARVYPEDQGVPGRDIFGRPLPAPLATLGGPLVMGPFIRIDDTGQLRAERFGYRCLHEGMLSVISPLHLSAEGLYLYWVVLGRPDPPVGQEMILPWLEDLGLEREVAPGSLEALLPQVAQWQTPCRYLLAQGQPPVPGKDSCLQIMVEVLPSFIEGQQIRFAPKVKTGEAVARRHLPSPGVAGRDLRGRPLLAPGDPYRSLKGRTGGEVRIGGGYRAVLCHRGRDP